MFYRTQYIDTLPDEFFLPYNSFDKYSFRLLKHSEDITEEQKIKIRSLNALYFTNPTEYFKTHSIQFESRFVGIISNAVYLATRGNDIYELDDGKIGGDEKYGDPPLIDPTFKMIDRQKLSEEHLQEFQKEVNRVCDNMPEQFTPLYNPEFDQTNLMFWDSWFGKKKEVVETVYIKPERPTVEGRELINAELIRDLINDSYKDKAEIRRPPGWAVDLTTSDNIKVLVNYQDKQVVICYKGWDTSVFDFSKIRNYVLSAAPNALKMFKTKFKSNIGNIFKNFYNIIINFANKDKSILPDANYDYQKNVPNAVSNIAMQSAAKIAIGITSPYIGVFLSIFQGFEQFDELHSDAVAKTMKIIERFEEYKIYICGNDIGGSIGYYVNQQLNSYIELAFLYNRVTGIDMMLKKKYSNQIDIYNNFDVFAEIIHLQNFRSWGGGHNIEVNYGNFNPAKIHTFTVDEINDSINNKILIDVNTIINTHIKTIDKDNLFDKFTQYWNLGWGANINSLTLDTIMNFLKVFFEAFFETVDKIFLGFTFIPDMYVINSLLNTKLLVPAEQLRLNILDKHVLIEDRKRTAEIKHEITLKNRAIKAEAKAEADAELKKEKEVAAEIKRQEVEQKKQADLEAKLKAAEEKKKISEDKKNTLALDRANAAQQRKVNAENKIRERERLAYNKSIQPHTTTRRTVSRTNTTMS